MAREKFWLGIFFSLVSTLAYSIVFVFSKAALNYVTLAQFSVYWFGIAFVENGIYFFSKRIDKQLVRLPRRTRMFLYLIAVLEVIGTALMFWTIKVYSHPAAVSFIAALIPVFVGILSFIFLHERFNFWETLGIVLTIIGTVIISYQGAVLGEITKAKLALAASLGFVLIFATNTILMRIAVRNVHPVMISFLRTVFMVFFWILVIFFSGETLRIPRVALVNIIIGATLGPFLGLITNIFALKYIEATLTSVIVNTKGFIVLVIAYFYLHLKPEIYQLMGGALAVFGVAILSYGKYLKEHSKISIASN